MQTIVVSSADELKQALASTKGTGDVTIELKAGDYGAVVIKGWTGGSLTITSADADDPAEVSNIRVYNSSNVTLSNLDFEISKATATSWTGSGLNIQNSTGVTVSGCLFDGGNNYSDQARGITVTGSSNIDVGDNEFTGLYRGAVFSHSSNLNIHDNSVHDNESEGFNFAAVTNVEIAQNSFTDFHAVSGDHPDAIQFWTNGTTTASANINIHDNVVLQGTGSMVQGIFMDNDAGITYENVTIENNVIYTSMANGIALVQADGATVENNTVVGVAGSNAMVGIAVTHSTDISVTNNISNYFNTSSDTNATVVGNVVSTTGGEGTAESYSETFANAYSGTSATGGDLASLHSGVGADVSALAGVVDLTVSAAATLSIALESGPAITGTDGADRLVALKSTSELLGYGGDDVMSAGYGNQLLDGGAGNDCLYGGKGADTFRFTGSTVGTSDLDKIMDLDFSAGDHIELTGFSAGTFKDAFGGTHIGVSQNGATVEIYSMADLVELDRSSSAVTVTEKGSTDALLIRIQVDATHVETIQLASSWSEYQEALTSAHLSGDIVL